MVTPFSACHHESPYRWNKHRVAVNRGAFRSRAISSLSKLLSLNSAVARGSCRLQMMLVRAGATTASFEDQAHDIPSRRLTSASTDHDRESSAAKR
jgi:hypothetical protein